MTNYSFVNFNFHYLLKNTILEKQCHFKLMLMFYYVNQCGVCSRYKIFKVTLISRRDMCL